MAEKISVAQGSTLKQEANRTFGNMELEQTSWLPAWKDLTTYIDPTRGIYSGDRTKIGKSIDHKTLLDSHATFAKRTTASGMQMGMTDQSRPWFRLALDEILMTDFPGARAWVDEVTKRMIDVMNKSNIYKTFQHCYEEVAQFGTGCFIILEDFDDVIRGRSFTVGEYMLATDEKGRVNRFARHFEMTVRQCLGEFGYESLCPTTQAKVKLNQMDDAVVVRHLIEPNDTRIPGYEDFRNMAYRSLYWEASTGGEDLFLAKRGFKSFRVVAPRWDTTTTDAVYGYGPGWHALGDIKQLQVTTKDKLIAEEKVNDPPTLEDANVVGHSNRLPGGVTKVSNLAPNTGLRPAYQIAPDFRFYIDSIQSLHEKIDRHFFADIFRMISNLEGQPNITAFQIAQMKQEQMMMLGPVLHSLNDEMHTKSIDIIFEIMFDAGLIPPPPPGLPPGTELKVQFLSILAQAQKIMQVQQIEQTILSLSQFEAVMPGITDNIDGDLAAKEIAEGNGIPGKLVRDTDQVQSIRADRVKQQNAQIALEAAQKGADAANKLGNTPMNGGPESVLDGMAKAAGR